MSIRATIGPIQPRGLSRELAAIYCGLTPKGSISGLSAELFQVPFLERSGGTARPLTLHLTGQASGVPSERGRCV
jgi:hypothetical protein